MIKLSILNCLEKGQPELIFGELTGTGPFWLVADNRGVRALMILDPSPARLVGWIGYALYEPGQVKYLRSIGKRPILG